jgi:DNA polymerase-3 subunit alpha
MFVASSEFSLGHSLLSVKDIISTVEANKLDVVIVADTMNVSSMIPLSEKLGGKLITGVRLTIVDEAEQAKASFIQPKVYPRNERGMQIIYKYLTRSFERPYFFMEPRLDLASLYEMLKEGTDDLLLSTGDFNSIFTHPKHKSILANILQHVEVVVDVCPIKTPRWDRVNYTGLKYALEAGLGVNPYIPCIYDKKDAELFPIHFSIHKNVEFNFLNPYVESYHYTTGALVGAALVEMMKRLEARYGEYPKAKKYTFDPAKFYHWQHQAPLLPQLSATPLETLKKLTIEGFKTRLNQNLFGFAPSREDIMTVYAERLKTELKALGDLGFSDYFLLVYELIDWCNKQDIKVGPGRGSVGGSLVAFCLGITDVDPVRFGLLFERFINPTRLDLPDIDLDFQTTRRGEIIEHFYDRYGRDNVAGIINYSSLQASSALRSTCRILGLAADEYACSKLVPSEFGKSATLEEAAKQVIDINTFAKTYPDYWDKATRLEKKLRNFSTHAAGVIVSSRSLVNDAVVEIRGKDSTRIINWDKKICEKQGLIKLDILGLTTLDIVDLCCAYIRDRHGKVIEFSSIPLDDPKVLEQFANGNTGGVFQMEGGSCRKMLKGMAKVTPLTFNDLIAVNALNRPGPIEAGFVSQYIDCKNGEKDVEVIHSSVAHITEDTYGVLAYQEQIQKIAVELAGFTLAESDNLRKAIGKKDKDMMVKYKDQFVSGASTGEGPLSHHAAVALWDKIEGFASYSFNKSHSCAYSLLGYQCMWLKTYYPVEFYAASLTYVDDKKVRSIIMEAKRNGISVDAPSINYSTDKFVAASDNRIVAPLSKIKYVQGAAKHIMDVRNDIGGRFLCKEQLEALTVKRLVNSRVMGAMEAVGALDELPFIPSDFDPVERSKAINEFLPSLPLGFVQIDRKIDLLKPVKHSLGSTLIKLKEEDENFVMPFLGASPKFMAVMDSATQTEARAGKFTDSKGFNSVTLALYKAELSKADGYWTGLVKRQKTKKEKTFSNDVLDASFKILLQEIEIIRPPVILCLGSAVSRMFVPTLKGSATDNMLQVHYDPKLDANIILGFSPGMLHFNPDLEESLVELFDLVGSMVN